MPNSALPTLKNARRVARPMRFVKLCALIVAMVLLSGCAWTGLFDPQAIESRIEAITDAALPPIDTHQMIQAVISCISDPKDTESIFESIPSLQRKDLTLQEFDAYVRALSRLTSNRGSISSYRVLDNLERSDRIDAILLNTKGFEEVLADTLPVELLFNNEEDIRQPVYIYLQKDKSGVPYLSGEWIRSCLEIYDLATLYFTALENQNRDVVETLIRSGYTQDEAEISDRVLANKAGKLVTYYHVNVKTAFIEYRLESLDISRADFFQEEVLDNESLTYRSQTVTFRRNASMGIEINDSIENKLNTKHFYLYVDGVRTIRIGDRADSNQFEDLFGTPIYVGRGFVGEESAAEAKQLFVASYNGMSVTLKGNLYEDGSWDGQIIRIRLRGTQGIYSIGTDIQTEIMRDDLLMLYPFADEAGFTLETSMDENAYRLSFVFGSNQEKLVTGVILDLVP